MLNYLLGQATTLNDATAIACPTHAIGHALYGPYIEYPAGRYEVTFVLAPCDQRDLDHLPDDCICATLDVVSDYGAHSYAYDHVTAGALRRHQEFRVAFDLTQSKVIEQRVFLRGRVALVVADEAKVASLSSAVDSSVDQTDSKLDDLLRRCSNRGLGVIKTDTGILVESRHLNNLAQLILTNQPSKAAAARFVAEAIAYCGDHMNQMYKAFVGTERPITPSPQTVPFRSTLCQQAHFALDQYRFWTSALKEAPRYYRKQWEFVYIAQVCYERGLLGRGRKGLVFGAGHEPLPALFASFGTEILATDQAPDGASAAGWNATGQLAYDVSVLNQRGICTDRMFKELVRFQAVDMNAVPESLDNQFDFCWSACALEHLGSLEHGLAFIERSIRTLKPGGVAIHTTEFNLSSNDATLETQDCSLFRRRDIEKLVTRLEQAGYEVAPIDWNEGEGFAELIVDLPPFGRGEPHIRLDVAGYQCTSIGLIITRPL